MGAIEWDCRQGEVKVRGMWDGRQPKRINEIRLSSGRLINAPVALLILDAILGLAAGTRRDINK